MKWDVGIRVNFYANVVLASSTTMFQEIGKCMKKETDGIIVYSHVLLCLQFFFFSGLLWTPCIFSLLLSDCDTFPTLHRAHMPHAPKKWSSSLEINVSQGTTCISGRRRADFLILIGLFFPAKEAIKLGFSIAGTPTYCFMSNDNLMYIRAIQGHLGGPVHPESLYYVAIPLGWKEYLCHVGSSFT